MSHDENKKDPKIIVDSDWKEQVAREKEAADAANTAEKAGTETDVSEAETANADVAEATGDQPSGEFPAPPPASFDVLVSMLFTQAMTMLGQMPDPSTGESKVNKPYAKHTIDTLDMLTEKTQGNLSDDEAKILSEALHALRMAYVNVKG